MKIIMAGQGKEFFFLCRKFIEKGYQVTLINKDYNDCLRLFQNLKINVLEGEAGDIAMLKQAGAEVADLFLSMTENDHDNLIAAQIARNEFSVPRVVALANDPENVEIFRKLGVEAFSITSVIASLIEERTSSENILNLQPLAKGLVNITEIKIETGREIAGKALKDLELPANVLVGVIIRNGKAIVPGGNDEVLVGDSIILLTVPDNHGRTIKVFTGEGK